jgi:hypothetical protein
MKKAPVVLIEPIKDIADLNPISLEHELGYRLGYHLPFSITKVIKTMMEDGYTVIRPSKSILNRIRVTGKQFNCGYDLRMEIM